MAALTVVEDLELVEHRAGAHVIATVSPPSAARVKNAGADQLIDCTTTTVLKAVTEQIDVLLHLAPIDPEQFASLVPLVRSGASWSARRYGCRRQETIYVGFALSMSSSAAMQRNRANSLHGSTTAS